MTELTTSTETSGICIGRERATNYVLLYTITHETRTPDHWVYTIDMWAADHDIATNQSMDLRLNISTADNIRGFRSGILRSSTYGEQW